MAPKGKIPFSYVQNTDTRKEGLERSLKLQCLGGKLLVKGDFGKLWKFKYGKALEDVSEPFLAWYTVF